MCGPGLLIDSVIMTDNLATIHDSEIDRVIAVSLPALTITLLGCPARAMLLVIIATIVCGRFAPSPSAWTTSAGRRLAVRRFESGNRTRTISPRRQFIVSSHFGPIPILG